MYKPNRLITLIRDSHKSIIEKMLFEQNLKKSMWHITVTKQSYIIFAGHCRIMRPNMRFKGVQHIHSHHSSHSKSGQKSILD